MIATSGFLTALECTKFVFGRPRPRWGSLQRLRPCSWFNGVPRLRGEEGKERGRKRTEKGRESRREEEKGQEK